MQNRHTQGVPVLHTKHIKHYIRGGSMSSTLFLCGGEGGLSLSAQAFVDSVNGGRVALLLQGGPNVQKYAPRYAHPWLEHGLTDFEVVAPDEMGRFNVTRALKKIERAAGIFVGGGNTAVYHRLYAAGPVGKLIQQRCSSGIPYGGLSAGMLIAGPVCPLDPEETGEPEVRLEQGLGLFKDMLFEPHFSSDDRCESLQAYLRLSGIPTGYGVDDETCVILRPGEALEVLGRPVIPVTLH
jgi:cyanophycinase